MKHEKAHWSKLYKRARAKLIKMTKMTNALLSESRPDFNRLEKAMARREKYYDDVIDLYYRHLDSRPKL